ncbi:MAG: hypothetical protein IKZ84_07485 [Victivallales bacterium]|nr:hypothetical protein [Victivallales bacterium]
MDFISRHYEKMILGASLLFLIVSLLLVAQGYDRTKSQLETDVRKSQRSVDQGELVASLTPDVFAKAPGTIRDARRFFSFIGSAKDQKTGRPVYKRSDDGVIDDKAVRQQGSLIIPGDYICCVEDKCRAIIMISENKCPFCGAEQPPISIGDGEDEDEDGDGIPDFIERKYRFLDPKNPLDARQDYDNDGFLNVEEYKYGRLSGEEELKTGKMMEDPALWPELVGLLRVVNIIQNDLKVQLRSIDQNGSEDPAMWDIGVRLPKQGPEARFFPDPKRSMNRNVKLNAVIRPGTAAEGAYRVTKAGFENKDGEKTPFIELTSMKDASEVYKLTPDETVKDKAIQVRFVYLANRIRANGPAILQKYSFIKKVGETLPPLARAKEKDAKYKELYRLEKANEDGTEVVIVKVDTAREEVTDKNKRVTVPLFDANIDFAVPRMNTNMMMDPDGGMNPGMMNPGMMNPGMMNPGMMNPAMSR